MKIPLTQNRIKGILLAAGEGFEPSHTESESAVLPLHNPAICYVQMVLYPNTRESQEFFLFLFVWPEVWYDEPVKGDDP